MANKCFSPNLAIFLAVLLFVVSVDHHHGVMGLRNLPEEILIADQLMLPHCGMSCRSDADCQRLTFCKTCAPNVLGHVICGFPM
ncbi:hypothetical protein HAX54_024701 [Datura stramonium]|uniref:WAP domain-containing protein n=1 Tax=Datura stramonium TaxID=4076 RepID=A0ABS8RGH1_DATST|nr:hypothetical protein [Datura stramonium]